jgi:hypothetical protein
LIYCGASRKRYIGGVDLGFSPAGTRIRKKVSGKAKVEVRDKFRENARTVPEGDGGTPPESDENLRRFIGAVTAAGARDSSRLGGVREYVPTRGRFPAAASSEPAGLAGAGRVAERRAAPRASGQVAHVVGTHQRPGTYSC